MNFHERFEIPVDIDEARLRFVNRIHNRIFRLFLLNESEGRPYVIVEAIANELGLRYSSGSVVENYVKDDYQRTLQAIQGMRKALSPDKQARFDPMVVETLKESELDLGITYEKGVFIKTGAKLLDEDLINEPLRWLSSSRYEAVRQPFEKGLIHLLEAENRPELLSDVVTDMYETLEALAKIVTGRDKDLSANAESFVKSVNISEPYKKLLKEYISYANNFRHAASTNAPKPNLSIAEVESFTYLTGVFIRLAMQVS